MGSGGELSAACWPAPVIRLGGLGRELPPWLPRLVLVLTRLGWESPSWQGGTRQAPPPRAGARAQDLNSLWLVSIEKMKGYHHIIICN